MGFMDKLKEAGKGALKGAVIMAARPYANVFDGKHKNCKISLNTTNDKLMFIKVSEIEEECVIKENVKTFTVISDDDNESFYAIKIDYINGESTYAHPIVNKRQGNALPSASERLAAQYADMSLLVEALARGAMELSDETKNWVNKIMRFASKPHIFK